MIYKVVKSFTDLQDDRHVYNAGDTFPRKGVEVSKERLKELSGTDNKLGIPLIVAEKPVKEEPVEEKPAEEEKPKKKNNTKRKSKNADRTVQRTE